MNAIRNKVTLIGNLGNDPEMKETDGGYKLAKVSLATNESYKNNKGEKVTETMWHNFWSEKVRIGNTGKRSANCRFP